jgi:Rrf2 family nitric oxide-sensitive transcriptional repressor
MYFCVASVVWPCLFLLCGFLMISKTAEYALRAVAAMATSSAGSLSADHLAKHTRVPRRYLSRVLQDLCASGMVSSRPGPGGGYELNVPAKKISILDIVNTVEPIARIRRCPLGLKTHTKLCPLHAELDRAYEATESAFAKVTIQDLLDSTSSIVPLCDSGKR